MKRKLGINVGCIGGMPILDQLDLVHNTGFETFFTGNQDADTVAALKEKADQYGMIFETIHAPFKGINNMWLSGIDYLPDKFD